VADHGVGLDCLLDVRCEAECLLLSAVCHRQDVQGGGTTHLENERAPSCIYLCYKLISNHTSDMLLLAVTGKRK